MQTFTKKLLSTLSISLVLLLTVLVQLSNAQTPPYFKGGTGGSANSFPFGSTASNKVQWIYFPSNFPTAITSGKITKLYFRTSSTSTAPFGFTNLVVKMGYTNLTTFASGPFETGLQTCLNASSYTIQPTGAGNWVEITLSTPFIYDPTKNFLVEVSQTAYTASGFSVYQQADPGNRRLYGGVSSPTGTAGSGGLADLGFNLLPLSYNDAGVATLDSPGTFCSGSSQNIYAKIQNFGNNQVTSVTINWSVDGVSRPSIPFNTLLDTINGLGSNTASVNLGSVSFPTSAGKVIKVWTSSPNNVLDTLNSNDTLTKVIKPSLAGTFTVGPIGRDYTTLGAVASDLSNFGVCGPVIINVDSAHYFGKAAFINIIGLSSTNTLTINGHGATLEHITDASPFVVSLNGLSYTTFRNFKLILNSASTSGSAMHLGNSHDCLIENNTFIGDMSNTTSLFFGLNMSGNAGATASPSPLVNNTIRNNEIAGGYYGLYYYASTAAGTATGNIIEKNTVRDFYYYGIYAAYADSLQVLGNEVHRLNRTSISVGYGIYLTTGFGAARIDGNSVHHMFEQAKTGTNTFYGIYTTNDGTVSRPNIIANNTIHNNTTNGSEYQIYNGGGDHTKYYYNTVAVNNPTATAGLVYGLYYPTAAVGIEWFNNNVYVNKGGSGLKYATYWSVITNPVISNYNNLFVENTGAGAKYVGRWGTVNYATLTDWKGANSGAFDQNSESADPLFSGYSFGIVKPNSPSLNNTGTPIASVLYDFDGVLRNSTTPDMGSYEFTPANDDAGIKNVISPIGICPGVNNVIVRVKNYGLSTLSSVILNWTVNGVAQTPFSYIGSVNSGSDTALTVGTFSFNGTTLYNIKIWTSAPNGLTDANAANDTVYINNLRTGLSGSFTLGGVGADFVDFATLTSLLNQNGICGPTTINVNAAAGPFTGPINLTNINGVSAANPLTFNGNGSVVNSNSNGFSLNNVQHVTIDSFVVNLNGASGIGISMMEGKYNTIRKNKVTIGQDKTVSTFSGIALSGSPSSATTQGRNSYNLIEDNQFSGGYYLLTILGTSGDTTSAVGNVVRNNKILDAYIYSIYTGYTDSTVIENNDINRIGRTLNISTFYGAYFTTETRNLRFRNNKIHSPFPAGYILTSASYLMYISADAAVGKENIFYNNAIYNIGGSGSVYCMYNLGSDGAWYYNNTIDIVGSGAGLVYGMYQSSAATNCKFINNSMNINRVSGTGARYGLYFVTATSGITSNFNHVDGGAGVIYGRYGTVDYSTLSAWKTANGGIYDQNSIDGDPLFNGVKNMIPKAGTPLLGAGTPLAVVPTDLKGDVRSSATPTIGAYENAGDYSGPSISFTPVLNTVSTTNYTLAAFATITDAAGVDTSAAGRPRIYYKRIKSANVYNDNTASTPGWKYVTATNTSSPFSFVIDYSKLDSAVVTNDEIQYFVVAQDKTSAVSVNSEILLSNDPANVNLTGASFPVVGIPNQYRISNTISGTFMVGAGKTFTSLTGNDGIFDYINDNVLSGDITINVTSNLTETGVNALNAFAEIGLGGYKINIQPISDTLRTISGAFTGGLIRLNGADRVTINGNNSGAGKFLRIQNTTTVSGSAGIQIISLGHNAGANNITIKNTEVWAGTAGNSIPIHIGGATIPYSPGASNNNIKIINNTILRGSVGIYSGSEAGFESDSLLVEGNTLGSDVTAEQIRLYGIAIEFNKNAIINNNTIKNVINTAAQQAWGIALYGGFKNGKITNNKIEKVSAGSGAFGGRGIEINTDAYNENMLVANNFIGGITGPGSTVLNSTANVGISIVNTGGVKLYYNSVNLAGSISKATTIPDTSVALYIGEGVNQLDIKNNTLNNTLINASDSSIAYALYSVVSDTAFTSMDYNNFYVNGIASQGMLARKGTLDLNNLANLKAAFTGKNTNSINVRSNFSSETDLHSKGINLYQKGTPIVGITQDLEADLRSTTTPCIGADEFVPLNNDLLAVKIIHPGVSGCGSNSDSVSVIVDNIGVLAQTGFVVQVDISGAFNGTISKTYTKSLAPSGRDTITVSSYNSNVNGTINFRAIVNGVNEQDRESDTTYTSSFYSPTPVAPTVVNDTVCSGSNAVLLANTNAIGLQWYTTANGGTPISSNDTLITGAINSDSTFYVEATNLGGSSSLTTTYVAGNGLAGAMFDIEATASPLLVTGFEWNMTSAVSSTLEIWTFNGTYVGNDASSTGWTLLHSVPVSTITGNNIVTLPVAKQFVLQPNNILGVYFTLTTGSIAYTNLPEPTIFQNTDMKITTGRGKSYPFSGGTSFVGRAWNGKVNYLKAGCPSPRVPVLVKLSPSPTGSTVAQSTPFEGVFNAGTLANADAACVGNVLTYTLTPPTGFTIGGLGTTWAVLNPTIKTMNGAIPVGTVTMTGLNLQYTAAAGDKDSTLVFTASIVNMSTGCTSKITRYLTIYGTPTVALGADQNICDGTTATLDAGNPGGTYLWSTGATTQSIQVSTAGTYSVQVSNAAGCSSRDTVAVITSPSPIANLGPNVSTCAGTAVTLDAGNPGATYLWNTGATTQTIQASSAGIYIVTVTKGICSDIDTIQVSLNALPVINLGGTLSTCTSDTLTLDAGNPGSTYLWNTGATTQTIRVNMAGLYAVTVTNANGCKGSADVVVNNKAIPNANFTYQGTNNVNVQFSATQQAGHTFNWNFGDPTSAANTSALLNPIHEYTAAGTYVVSLTVTSVATGCRSVMLDTIVVTQVGLNASARNTQNLKAIPNPFVGQTSIAYTLADAATSVTIEIYDVIGRRVATVLNAEAQQAGKHNINYKNEDKENTSGVYIVRLTVDGKTSITRIVDIASK